jgi:hypothetical protein
MKKEITVPCFLNPAVNCPPECPSHDSNLQNLRAATTKANAATGENVSPEEGLERARAVLTSNRDAQNALDILLALTDHETAKKDCLKAKEIFEASNVSAVRLG